MTSGSLEFTVTRASNPATDAEREAILAEPGFGKYHTDHMVSIDYDDGPGLARRAGDRLRPNTAGSVGDRVALRAGGVRRAQGVPLDGRVDRVVSPRGQRRPAALVGAAPRHSRTARRAFHRIAASAHRRRQRLGARRRRGRGAVSAAVHLRHRAGAGGAPVQAVPVPADRLAGRRVLQGRHQSRQRVGVDGVRAGLPGRHRCGQVRRQLRGVAAGSGPGRRKRLRPSGVAGRRRAALSSKRWAG